MVLLSLGGASGSAEQEGKDAIYRVFVQFRDKDTK